MDDWSTLSPCGKELKEVTISMYIVGQFVLAFIQITKEHVDSCGTENEIPHCELSAEWTRQDKRPSHLKRKVILEGAKKPYDYFLIAIDTTSPGSTLTPP